MRTIQSVAFAVCCLIPNAELFAQRGPAVVAIVPPPPGETRDYIGRGYFTATGEFSPFTCVDTSTLASSPNLPPDQRTTGGGEATWIWDEANSLSQMQSSQTTSAAADGSYRGVTFSGSFDSAQSIERSSYSHTVVGRSRFVYPGPALPDSARLTPEAAKLRNDPLAFYSRCGDRFVKSAHTGGGIYLIATLLAASDDEKQNLTTKLNASVSGTFTANASGSETEYLHTLEKSGRLSIRVLLRGPVGTFS